jgi:3-keto-disaccharide hydrolase
MKASTISLLLLTATALYAAEKKYDPVFLDPASAGQDYADQGEYKNDWGGAQVIALGDGAFRMVTYPGGLPGAGWNHETKMESSGKRQGAKVVFSGDNGYHAELASGKITITTDNGGPYTMEKVERKSPTLGAKPPLGAVVLFDGASADAWAGGHMDDQHRLFAGCKSKQSFNDFTVHLEFYLPFKPFARGQERANSGVYLQDRYELQVLDSFGLEGRNDDCGAFSSQQAPSVNLCFPPLTWQTYDIEFTAAKFGDSGKKVKDAVATVRQNGVLIQDHAELKGPTPGGKREDSTGGPLQLQGHGNPVFYRNIWVVPR